MHDKLLPLRRLMYFYSHGHLTQRQEPWRVFSVKEHATIWHYIAMLFM